MSSDRREALREHEAALLKLARFMYEAPEGTDHMEQLGTLIANVCNGLPALRAALAAEPPALDVDRSKACPLDLDCYRFQGHDGEHMYARLARKEV